jgi:hypothetical protein
MYLVALNMVRVCMNSVMDVAKEVAPSVNVNGGLFVRAVHTIDQRRLSPWSRGLSCLMLRGTLPWLAFRRFWLF